MPHPFIVDLHQFSGWPLRAGRVETRGHVREPRHPLSTSWRMLAVDGRPAGLRGCWRPRCFRRSAACAVFRAARSTSTCAASAVPTCPGSPRHRRASSCALRFAPPVDDLIRELKYHGVIANARVLGVLLAQAVRGTRRRRCRDCWCPCRCTSRACVNAASTRRRRSRVTPAACWAFRCARHAVRRVRDTPSQTSLEHGRAASQCARRIRRQRRARAAQVVSGAATSPSSMTS